VWVGVLVLPWQPHRVRERLEADSSGADADLSDLTVLIPARDEAETLGAVVAAVAWQGRALEVLVIDDQSSDGTADVATRAAAETRLALRVLTGAPLPVGWAGKLWALDQGLAAVERPFVLLLDADIELAPGMLPALLRALRERQASLVSIMAELRCAGFWEKLLTPAFVFFFKLLYPFALANDATRATAAAAGGCILLRTKDLRAIGGFAAIRGALIDDCTLAARIKGNGGKIWLGMSHSVRSLRAYPRLDDFWQMVSRTAFTQLRYSLPLLLLATVLLALTLLLPLAASAAGALRLEPSLGVALAALAWLAASAAYWPTVGFYRLRPVWALTLPLAAALFLAMTWGSAFGYWRGTRAAWKNRTYGSTD